MEDRLRIATFDTMKVNEIADLLDKMPLKNPGMQLVAESLAKRIIETESSGDHGKARRVSYTVTISVKTSHA